SLMGGPSSADAPTDGEHRMGTTIVGVCYAGGVVLAADSRTSTGTPPPPSDLLIRFGSPLDGLAVRFVSEMARRRPDSARRSRGETEGCSCCCRHVLCDASPDSVFFHLV
uniref:Uncharacterized protein n=1 Tax=Aegilops tauschii subsp. strangulata TaxID=200361 RepID=A0A453QKN1_AEGTS